jgi:UDP-N-acetylglucosamine 4,6-dehydratase
MLGGEVFVPKIPSMKMTDLAEALAPACERTHIGIRPGEKLHEVLLSEDEARHSVELADSYVITPMHPWWKGETVPEGKSLPEGFRYGSDNNSEWLTKQQLGELIDESGVDSAAQSALAD